MVGWSEIQCGGFGGLTNLKNSFCSPWSADRRLKVIWKLWTASFAMWACYRTKGCACTYPRLWRLLARSLCSIYVYLPRFLNLLFSFSVLFSPFVWQTSWKCKTGVPFTLLPSWYGTFSNQVAVSFIDNKVVQFTFYHNYQRRYRHWETESWPEDAKSAYKHSKDLRAANPWQSMICFEGIFNRS